MASPSRTDARRNRERLLEVAAARFAAGDASVSLESVAREAGVGIGTLYRHFPTREALVEAVYRAELAEVSEAAAALVATEPPELALRRWIARYAAFVAAKKGMADTLRVIFGSGAMRVGDTRANVTAAVETLLRAGAADGSLRADVRADDVVLSLVGIVVASGSPEQERRMFDLLVDGIVTSRGPGRAGAGS